MRTFKRLFMMSLWTLGLSGCLFNTGETVSDKDNAVVHTRLGMEYLSLGQLTVAQDKLLKAIELDSENVDAHDALAVLYEKITDFPKAQQHFEEALNLSPGNTGTLNNYGRFLCERGDFQTGIAYLKQAREVPLNNNKWFALTNLGRCELLMGKQEAAEAYFRDALQLQPRYAPALLELQRVCYRQGNYLSAQAFMQRYLEVAEHTAGTLWVAIQTETALGNTEQAASYRELLLQKYANSYEAKQVLAASRKKAGLD